MTSVFQAARSTAIVVLATACCLAAAGCDGRMILTDQAEARRLGASLHVNFVRANEAASRAVMSEADEASAAAAREARSAAKAAQDDLEKLEQVVQSLGDDDEIALVGQFGNRFAEYRQLDEEVLGLAVENTNLKAQQLAFGEAQESAGAMMSALDRLTRNAAGSRTDALAGQARSGVLEIQVLQARHIAEPDEPDMARMEAAMSASEQRAREALINLRAMGAGPAPAVADALEALDRFVQINSEIVQLSRRNSNVRSLAVTLGRKRVVAAECESQLRALEEALAAHTFTATR